VKVTLTFDDLHNRNRDIGHVYNGDNLCSSNDISVLVVIAVTVLRIVGYSEDLCLQGYNAVQSAEIQPMFWRNVSLSCSGSKNKPSKKSA
jgi:hypothetical protein